MILTGPAICAEITLGRIVIDPFDPAHVEPNSYGFHLGHEVLSYYAAELDAAVFPPSKILRIPDSGLVLEPGRLYLSSTLEKIGSTYYATTLHARLSTSTLGMWIQMEAPLGHTGAIIHWTLEIRVMHATRVYPGMLIGKVAFWSPSGELLLYDGRYKGSIGAVSSRLFLDRALNSSDGAHSRASAEEERT